MACLAGPLPWARAPGEISGTPWASARDPHGVSAGSAWHPSGPPWGCIGPGGPQMVVPVPGRP